MYTHLGSKPSFRFPTTVPSVSVALPSPGHTAGNGLVYSATGKEAVLGIPRGKPTKLAAKQNIHVAKCERMFC